MKKPNILIVMTDHQRADTVLPDNPCIMPNVKKMATEGVNFTKTYPPMAHCCPARATFMSGLYPSRSGVWNNVNNEYAVNHGPHRDIRFWSQDLKDAGYYLPRFAKMTRPEPQHVFKIRTRHPSSTKNMELRVLR